MPPRKKVKKTHSPDRTYSKLILTEVLCPLCRTILVEPVTLPCTHGFCNKCFSNEIEDVPNRACPLCRARFGSWYRTANKDNKVINRELWAAIQRNFPSLVERKREGLSSSGNAVSKSKTVCNTVKGPLRKHIQSVSSPEQCNNKTTCQISLTADDIDYEKRVKYDMLADVIESGTLQRVDDKIPILKEVTNSMTENLDNSSDDSIGKECWYFKPIEIFPAKPAAVIHVPVVIRKSATPIIVNINIPSGLRTLYHNHRLSAFVPFKLPVTNNQKDAKGGCNSSIIDTIQSEDDCIVTMTTNNNRELKIATKSTNVSTRKLTGNSTMAVKRTLRHAVKCAVNVTSRGRLKATTDTNILGNRCVNGVRASIATRTNVFKNVKMIMDRKQQEQTDYELAKSLHILLNRNTRRAVAGR